MNTSAAVNILESCEQELRKLISTAVTDGDYASVIIITDLAKAVAALAAESKASRTPASDSDINTVVGSSRAITSPDTAKSQSIGATGYNRKRPSAGDYPRFHRRGEELVKVGWSKKMRKEYHHRAPRIAVDLLVIAVKQAGLRGKVFSSDDLIPLKSTADAESATLPEYQAFVALAWLRHLGLVQQHGRKGGYTLVTGKQIESTIATAWAELTEWRG